MAILESHKVSIINLQVFRNLLINLTNKLFDVMNIWGKARNFNFERNFLQRHCLKSFALKNFCHRFALFPFSCLVVMKKETENVQKTVDTQNNRKFCKVIDILTNYLTSKAMTL